MACLTLQVVDGADRGVVYDHLETPITIGREEGNSVQLNDERISRFHVKVQEDQGKIVLTDLQSTNGTRVNGNETQLRILQFGDLIMVGRSILLYGSREQIATRIDDLRRRGFGVPKDAMLEKLTGPTGSVHGLAPAAGGGDSVSLELSDDEASPAAGEGDPSDSRFDFSYPDDLPSALHLPAPPDPPEGLTPAQAAQVSEMLEYFHLRCRALLHGVAVQDDGSVVLPREQWQEMVDLQAVLAQSLRRLGESG